MVHAVDGKAHGSHRKITDRNIAHGAHGVDFALGIRRNVDCRMLCRSAHVDVRVVQGGPVVLVDFRYRRRSLEVEGIFAPAHADAGAHGGDTGLLRCCPVRLAVRGGDFNFAAFGRRDVDMVHFRPQHFFVLSGTNGGVGNGAADTRFGVSCGHGARRGGLLRQIRRRDGEILHSVQLGIGNGVAHLLAVDDAFRVAPAPVDGHGSDGALNGLARLHIHSGRHRQRGALVRGREGKRGRVGQIDSIARQIRPGGVVEGIVGKGQPEGHAPSSGDLSGDIEDGSVALRLFADGLSRDGVVLESNLGIVLEVVPAAGARPVERLAADGSARSHGNDQGFPGGFAIYGIRLDDGVFDVRRDIVLHIVVGNARADAGLAVPASGHGGSDRAALVRVQCALGGVLIVRRLVRTLAAVGILACLVKGGFCLCRIEIALPCGVYAFFFKEFLVLFVCVRRVLQKGFGVLIKAFIAFDCIYFFDAFLIGLEDRAFACFDIYRAFLWPIYGCPGNIGVGGVLCAGVGKRAFKAVTAVASGIGRRQRAVELGSFFLGFHVHRQELLITAADDAAGQIVFQIADGHSAARAHVGGVAVCKIGLEAARDLIIRALRLVGECSDTVRPSRNGVVDHQGMDVLLCPIVIHHARAKDIRAVALGGADAHACRRFDARLGCGIRDRLHLLNIGISQQGIHIPRGVVHGESAADAHLGRGAVRPQRVLSDRAAEGDGTEDIRRGKGDGFHVSSCGIFHHHVIQHGVRPASEECQGNAALNADGRPRAFARPAGGSRAVIFRRLVRICRLSGLLRRLRSVRCSPVILRRYFVLFQLFGVLLDFLCSLSAFLGPLAPLFGVLPLVYILYCVRRGGGNGLGLCVVLEQAHGDGRNGKLFRGDAALHVVGRGCPQFSREGIPGNVSRQRRVLKDFLSGFSLVRGFVGGRTISAAIVADHGNAVHVIVDNAHADAERLGAFAYLRLAAGGVVYVCRIHGSEPDRR